MKPLWLAGAVALAVLLVLRRRKLEPPLLVGGALAVIGSVLYGAGVVEFPDVEQLAEDVGETLGKWTYLLVPVMAFLETGAFIGLLAPGETVMVLGGVVAGQGRVSLPTLIGLVWVAAVLGDLVSFWLGRRLGRGFLERHGPKFQITEERLKQVEAFYGRHGGKAVLLGRFVGLVRAVSPFLAGSSGMALKRFVPYDVLGAGLWSATFLVLGYVFWQSFGTVLDYAKKGAFALGTTIVVIVGATWAVRWLREEEHRDELRAWVVTQLERPGLRPLARVLRPLWRTSRGPRRFVWARVTPGDLGLELTTLLAVAAAGGFALVSPLLTLQSRAFALGDEGALELADELRQDTVVDVAKVVTGLGALPTAIVVVVVAAAVLASRREIAAAAGLVSGMTVTFVLVHLIKDWEDRPRPANPLTDTTTASFPSGHAAYAIAWVAATVALTRLVPGVARATALVASAIVLAALIAVTRVYLRAHYVSDVVAGAGLSAAVFALCGMIAMMAARQHRRAGGTAPSATMGDDR